jgi:uncharacterized protein YutE (UPF0331/DUF86 family)
MNIELNKQVEDMVKSIMKEEGYIDGEEGKFVKWLCHLYNLIFKAYGGKNKN